MTTDAVGSVLELHVLNAGYGESIVLHLPNDEWGVVDCYAASVRDPNTNAAIQFLKQRNVTRLEFLCLTHPHDDHYRGMSQFFDLFAIKYFWQFGGMSFEGLQNLVIHMEADALVTGDTVGREAANDFQLTLQRVKELRKAGSLAAKHMSDIKPLYPEPFSTESPLRIFSIAPSTDQVLAFQDGLKACFTREGRLRSARPNLDANMISAALLVQFGSTSIILGGDVEKKGWDDTVRQLGKEGLAAHAIKVSHHGSSTGQTEGLWAAFAGGGKPFAIITPSQKHGLPQRAMVQYIAGHACSVLTTCLPAISFATPRSSDFWEDYPLATRFALMSKFNGIRANRPHDVGVCSLAFDNRGNSQSLNLSPPAGPLTV